MSGNTADEPKCSREAKKLSNSAQNDTTSNTSVKMDASTRGSASSLRDSTVDRTSVVDGKDDGGDDHARPASSKPSNGRPTSSKSRSRVSLESDIEEGSVSRGSDREDGQSTENMDGIRNRPKTGHHRLRKQSEAEESDKEEDVDDLSDLVSALRHETENLALRDGPSGLDEWLTDEHTRQHPFMFLEDH
eukprot:XP_011682352.1 PREDICTED: uncharacterized protein LOC105446794 [Strongylocentrotus purpuratus]